MEEPVISFDHYEIIEYIYKKVEKNNENNEEPFEISVEASFSNDYQHGKLNVRGVFQSETVSINIEVAGYFIINSQDEPEILSNYLVINGTAILFPYIRSMISMLSSLDSENAIILPTINTNNLLST